LLRSKVKGKSLVFLTAHTRSNCISPKSLFVCLHLWADFNLTTSKIPYLAPLQRLGAFFFALDKECCPKFAFLGTRFSRYDVMLGLFAWTGAPR